MTTPGKFLVLMLGVVTACGQQELIDLGRPMEDSDGWAASTPAEEGLNQESLRSAIQRGRNANSKLDALLVARNGKLIVDLYFNGYYSDSLHKIWSITKMISGTALGIARDQGHLSEKDSIGAHLAEYLIDKSPSIHNIKIEHLVTMTSGIAFEEFLGGSSSEGYRLPYSRDWVDFTLSLDHPYRPGSIFNYSSGNTILLAPIMKNATGLQASEFASEFLFKSMDISRFEWDKMSEFWTKTQGGELPDATVPDPIDYELPFADYTNTATGLRMRPRDLCKFGQLYLDGGKWKDVQVVSTEWVKASTQPHHGNDDYGYHWRIMTFEDMHCFYATGFGLQRIFVFPAIEMVVVTVQGNYANMAGGNHSTEKLLRGILAAVD